MEGPSGYGLSSSRVERTIVVIRRLGGGEPVEPAKRLWGSVEPTEDYGFFEDYLSSSVPC